MFKIAVLASGSGTNFQSIIDNIKNGFLKAEISCLIVDRKCYAQIRAINENIPCFELSREFLNKKILEILKDKNIDLIVLAGFLSILDENFVNIYKNKIINIHPSLLPKFGGPKMYGIKVHEAVLRKGEKESGCSVHFVDSSIDGGQIIAQRVVKIKINDDALTLQKRILKEEHILLNEVINKFIQGEL